MDSYSHGDQTNAAKLIIKVGLSPSKKKLVLFASLKALQKWWKRLKNPFRSEDISVFVMTFLSCRKRRFH